MNEQELREILAKLEQQSKESAPYFNERIERQIENIRRILREEFE